MPKNTSTTEADELARLIEIWEVLEALTVSFDRLGSHWRTHGEDAAKEALHTYISPPLVQRIARARRQIIEIMEGRDSHIQDRLEELAQDEAAIGYWTGNK